MHAPDLARRLEKAIRRHLGARRFQAYCVGAAKTGTTSVSRLFAPHYLSAHEPDTVRSNRLAIDFVRGRLSEDAVRPQLVDRDRRLRLELESSHPLGYLAPVLQNIYPRAKFVITVRDPFSWLRSRVNFHDATDPPKWRAYRQFFWYDQHREHHPEEAVLARHGLVSVDVYLAQYADHYRRLVRELDWSRALVIRTHELGAAPAQLERFLGLSERTLVPAHAKRARSPVDLLGTIDEAFVRSRILMHCEEILTRWFPERIDDYA